MKARRAIFLFVALVFIDQLSKYTVRRLGGFYICNKGIAFGLQIPIWLYLGLLALLIIFFSFKFIISNFDSIFNVLNFKNWKFNHWNLIENWKLEIGNSKPVRIGFILMISGALSNILDRLYFGCVVDFINLQFWPLFNLADSFIAAIQPLKYYKYF